MLLLRRAIDALRGLFQRARVEQAMDAELRDFLETAIDDKMQAGLSRAEALRAAQAELGSVEAVKDGIRDVGWASLLESFWQDVRYGARMLRRSPAFAVTAIGILGLGIGANAAIFSVINPLMLEELPVRDPAQLVELLGTYPGEPRRNGFSREVYEHYRDGNHVFSDLIGVSAPLAFELRAAGRNPEPVVGEYVVGSFFTSLGVQPAAGRLIGPDDDTPGHDNVAVVSWSFWQRRFNLDPSIVNTRILLDGAPATVIGVAPRGFVGLQVGARRDVWLPTAMAGKPLWLGLMGRLKAGASIEQARAEMRVLDRWRIDEIAKASNDPLWRKATIDLVPAGAGFSQLRNQFGGQLRILMALVALLLLIACTSLASMLVARGASRRRELALRVALGAGRLRLVRQAATETLLILTAGGVLGIVLAYFGADALVRSWRPDVRGWGSQPVDISVWPDARVLLFTSGIALLTGLLFGLPAAWNAFSSAPGSLLREAGGHGDTKSRRVFGQSLVIAQVAVSMVLLSAASLFVAHLSSLRSPDRLGFHRDSVLLVTLDPRGSGYNRDDLLRRYQELLGSLQAIPGVRSATLSAVTPIQGPGISRFATVESFPSTPQNRRYLSVNVVAPRYFETLGTPLVAGRDFRFEDQGAPRVAIVNRAMARYYFGDRNPIGKHFTFDRDTLPYEIVGVAGDSKYSEIHEPAPRTVYLNAFQEERNRFSQFALRTSGPPNAVAAQVRRTVSDALKTVAVSKITTLSDQVDAAIRPERLIARLSGLFGLVGAMLAACGLYGLLAYTVARRTRELGVRMALGATRRTVMGMVLKGTLGLVGTGLIVGAPIAIWSRRFAESMVDNLSAGTTGAIVSAAAGMVAVALLAAYVPARRAARVDPMEALRHE